ncbi:MAG: MoaD/ThiS family protein [Anaerolineales bacterium]
MPSALRALYQTQRIEDVEAKTIGEVTIVLNERYPGIHDRLMEPDGSLRRYVNVFVEGEDGRWPGEADSQVEDDKQVWIVPNIAGGAAPGGART